MYLPRAFRGEAQAVQAFLLERRFGQLVSVRDGLPQLSHLPMEYLPEQDGQPARVLGHMAAGNKQWRDLKAASQALVVFDGPGAYISPSWYTEPNVPTWNYLAVHLRGPVEIIEPGDRLATILQRSVDRNEAGEAEPRWFEQYDPAMVEREMRGAIGFCMSVQDCQAQFKLSQNRDARDHANIVRQLDGKADDASQSIAAAMMCPVAPAQR